MARILAVGVAVLDIVHTVDGYPAEDAKVRAEARRVACGGNAANTLIELAALGHRCELAAALGDDGDAGRVRSALEDAGVGTCHCRVHAAGRTPVSLVVHNRRNGSRTIVHYRDLPEYGAADFAGIPRQDFDWLHFEGRNVADTARMLRDARDTGARISLEVEKARPGIEALFDIADLLLFGSDFVRSRGEGDPAEFLRALRERHPGKDLVCAWGADGAWAIAADGETLHCPAWRPPRLVDTLGAGDTFNAGIIDALLADEPLGAALARACRLAGEKCGIEGRLAAGNGRA